VKLLRHQHIDIGLAEPSPPVQSSSVRPLSHAERAHYRLSWKDRLARNARRDPQPQLSQSRSLGYQTLLPLLSASTSPEFGSSGQAAQEMFVFFFHLFSRCVLLSSSVSLFCFFTVL